jgi:formylglycine-generating enzyme required for sulfatase activity
VRIFLASSEELREHRDAFEQQVRRLNDRWIAQRGIYLQPVRWEHFLDAMSATRLQDEYNAAIAGCDLFVMLFRTKVGKYTAEEFEKAFGQFQETGRPRIYTYFHDELQRQSNENRDHKRSLWAFQDRLQALGHFQTNYETVEGLLLHFTEQLERLYPVSATVASAPLPADAPPALADLRPYVQQRAATWRAGAAGQLDRRFVNLTLMVDHGLEYNGPRHEAQGRYDRLSDLLAERPDVGAWVLVGAPGAGKSTVLQHHEMTTADAALARLAATVASGGADAGDLPEICIWHRLSEYDAERSPPPAEWLQLPTRWPQALPPLATLRQVARVRWLLDGLNEIKAPNRDAQLAAVDRWTEWAAAEASHAEHLAPVFSVRTLDQSPMSAGAFEVRQIVLAPWSPAQIQAYCAHTLGEGNALWPSIEADRQLLALSELPFNLAAQCELFRTLGRAARDRAELLGGLFWQMLAKRQGEPKLRRPGLLGEADWQHIAAGKWKDTLRALPERHGCLVPWLDDALQRLHRRGRQVSVTQAELLAPLTPQPGWASPADWLQAVRCLNLIGDGGHDEFSTDPLLRCTHQLWQEFFAARGIRDGVLNQPERLPDFTPPALPDLEATVASLGLQEPLPGPDATHWEEPVKLAVQLLRDPAPWITHLQPRNLPLAGRAAVAARSRLTDATLAPLRKALLARSRDPAVDLRLRIEAGLVLGELGDPRYEERQGPQGRYLWPKQWVKVPGGVYRIGDDESDYDNQKPETEVTLAPFEMAFAPVTNAEYRCFVEAGGYRDERCWEGETAKQWLKEGVRNETEIETWRKEFAEIRHDCEAWISVRPGLTEASRETFRNWSKGTEAEHDAMLEQWYGAQRFEHPQEWFNPQFNAPTQPVVGICAFEARAYARWLQAQTGKPLRLPTEAEWEAAARGAQRRRWPWGEADPERWQIAADPSHLRRSSPVGVFVQADSPDGLTDLAGNVWEWTTSAYTDRLDATALQTEAPDGLARRVLRGGSWGRPSECCRASFRHWFTPDDRNLNFGLRLVVSCPIPGTEP